MEDLLRVCKYYYFSEPTMVKCTQFLIYYDFTITHKNNSSYSYVLEVIVDKQISQKTNKKSISFKDILLSSEYENYRKVSLKHYEVNVYHFIFDDFNENLDECLKIFLFDSLDKAENYISKLENECIISKPGDDLFDYSRCKIKEVIYPLLTALLNY
jgi:hypothetical protein